MIACSISISVAISWLIGTRAHVEWVKELRQCECRNGYLCPNYPIDMRPKVPDPLVAKGSNLSNDLGWHYSDGGTIRLNSITL